MTSPSHVGTRVIAEVKGYVRGGARTGDLVQIGQHALRYAQRHGQVPDRTWYVVNQFAARDPDTRPQPLAGARDDVAVFAQGGGLIIDTRDLFKLHQLVLAGEITSADARDSLITQQGVFVTPAPSHR